MFHQYLWPCLGVRFGVLGAVEQLREYCAAILTNCVTATDPNLKGDPDWLAFQEKKSESKK